MFVSDKDKLNAWIGLYGFDLNTKILVEWFIHVNPRYLEKNATSAESVQPSGESTV
ncbi:uncharacterized protein PHALS_04321 [Plasmopara halstedii]|uniref:Uncharacterized protein n=1 Tax=Plasmopara halstedii TaxID=4781 RepID=A0A0P1B0Z3_PLAHL|nr:uncharacterized protein PHALS_04321 [Plasmopara halstedii]CEG47447.1 hypothetical protein PHALS_04321 [Plasmopara halstedii]|eukprot:XP_024583816.1 hypothetical protein PHALS_04321 [Plasmopara halstedii]